MVAHIAPLKPKIRVLPPMSEEKPKKEAPLIKPVQLMPIPPMPR